MLDRLQAGRVGADHREIGFGIGADELCRRLLPVGERHEDLVCIGDDVRVRQDVAVARARSRRSPTSSAGGDSARSPHRRVLDSAAARRSDAAACGPTCSSRCSRPTVPRRPRRRRNPVGRRLGVAQSARRTARPSDAADMAASNRYRMACAMSRSGRSFVQIGNSQSNSGSQAEPQNDRDDCFRPSDQYSAVFFCGATVDDSGRAVQRLSLVAGIRRRRRAARCGRATGRLAADG